jgi:hypothetical protein
MPWIGMAVWVAILVMAPFAQPHWGGLPGAIKGSIFLLSLVLSASMMPVDKLPSPSALTTLTLGFVSAVFDNIPLTKLALQQGGYDWGYLAYAVGFGGSMIWFGSSAGVALSNNFPEAKSVGKWLYHGWHVALAYVVGFGVLHAVMGWQPESSTKTVPAGSAVHSQSDHHDDHVKPNSDEHSNSAVTPKVEATAPAYDKQPTDPVTPPNSDPKPTN